MIYPIHIEDDPLPGMARAIVVIPDGDDELQIFTWVFPELMLIQESMLIVLIALRARILRDCSIQRVQDILRGPLEGCQIHVHGKDELPS